MFNLDFQLEDVFILLTPASLLLSLIGGFFMGVIYHRRVKTTPICLYTTWVSSTAFFVAMALIRSTESTVWERWIGIAILYGIFTFTSYVGSKSKF